jgi:mitochondrial import inner membrane translocase subunit TIM23
MSVRSAFGGRVTPATVSSLISSTPLHQSRFQMASKQLARLHSTAIRPPRHAVPRVAFLPQVRSSQTSLGCLASRRAQSTSAASKDQAKLDWNSFFKLRASRRRYSLASSIVTSLVSTAVGVQFLSTQDLESLGAQVMGLDPFVVLGLATAACGAVGWLVGPIVGNGTWGLVHRRFKPSFATVSTESARAQREK